jgi:hypothetical protein
VAAPTTASPLAVLLLLVGSPRSDRRRSHDNDGDERARPAAHPPAGRVGRAAPTCHSAVLLVNGRRPRLDRRLRNPLFWVKWGWPRGSRVGGGGSDLHFYRPNANSATRARSESGAHKSRSWAGGGRRAGSRSARPACSGANRALLCLVGQVVATAAACWLTRAAQTNNGTQSFEEQCRAHAA